jgi:hypothetical protein
LISDLNQALDKYGRLYVWGCVDFFKQIKCKNILIPTMIYSKEWVVNARFYGPHLYLETFTNTIVCSSDKEMNRNKKFGSLIDEIWWWLELARPFHLGRYSYYNLPQFVSVMDIKRNHFDDIISTQISWESTVLGNNWRNIR